jgi:HK97 gp10 family phage protein
MAKSGAFNLKLSGDKELIRALDALARKDAAAAIRKGIRAGGNIMLAAAKAYVPKDEGDLKRSLKLRVSKKKKRQEYALRVQTGESAIGTGDQFYARMLEYGTSKMEARPWLRPAFAHNRSTAARVAKEIILSEILRRANKAGK